MTSKNCDRCQKTVYSTEELLCLDKVWHKTCFRCAECGMQLNLKTYHGFNKLPYCSPHYPQIKHTSVVKTPEFQRLAENTAMQSQARYHQDFEKQKGKLTVIADDPEILRAINANKIASDIRYKQVTTSEQTNSPTCED